ncbi:hypothetical protein OF83DRAFT_872238 [Amylostereum chailletii]|nr:hypothetical protein OF83DRAFT_872238 [Amylostereum chailletii]
MLRSLNQFPASSEDRGKGTFNSYQPERRKSTKLTEPDLQRGSIASMMSGIFWVDAF